MSERGREWDIGGVGELVGLDKVFDKIRKLIL